MRRLIDPKWRVKATDTAVKKFALVSLFAV